MDFPEAFRAWEAMDFDDEPGTSSIWHGVIILVIAILMNAIAIFLLAKAFPPQRHAAQPAQVTSLPRI